MDSNVKVCNGLDWQMFMLEMCSIYIEIEKSTS